MLLFISRNVTMVGLRGSRCLRCKSYVVREERACMVCVCVVCGVCGVDVCVGGGSYMRMGPDFLARAWGDHFPSAIHA